MQIFIRVRASRRGRCAGACRWRPWEFRQGTGFSIIDTTYTLTPLDASATELRVQFRYRVSTDFNWYADAVARLLIGNFEEVILGFYRQRAIAAPG